MNAIQLLAKSYKGFNTAKGKDAGVKVAREVQRLRYQWLREFLSDNPRLLTYLELVEKSTNIPEDLEDITKHIHNSNKKIISEIKANGVKRKRTAAELLLFKEDYVEFQRAVLMLDIELFNSDQLTDKWKITIGKELIKLYKILMDFYSVSSPTGVIDAILQNQVAVITEKVREQEMKIGPPELFYWPIGAVPFHQAMEKLKYNKFILDITLAEEIFKKFENQTGQTLKWIRSKRELIYFLLMLYGGRTHYAEKITDIAFKLFTLKKTCPPIQFTNEIILIEDVIKTKHDYELGARYFCLKNILSPDPK